MPRSLLSSFLNGIADLLEVFSIERRDESFIDDRITLISFLMLTVAVSFSKSIYSPLISFSLAFFLTAIFNVNIKHMLKVVGAVAIFVIAITLPMTLYQAYLNFELRESFITELITVMSTTLLPLLLRATAAAMLVTLMVQCLGLTRLIRGLRGLGFPSKMLFILMVYIRYIPIMLRQLIKLLSAREARLVCNTNKLRSSWLMLSTVVGSLLIKGFDKAFKLQVALKARGLDYDLIPKPSGKIGPLDLTFIALTFMLSLILVLM